MGERTGPNNPNWKGGRVVDPRGYVLIHVGKDHHLADVRGYAYEHWLIAEEKLGRWLTPEEEVHHENELNLPWLEHRAQHRKRKDLRLPGEPNPEIECACGCGERLLKFDGDGRPRRFAASGHVMRLRSRRDG